MTEAQAKSLNKEITEFMNQLAKKYDFCATRSKISYSDSEFTLTFKGNSIDKSTGKKIIDANVINRASRALFKAGNYALAQQASIIFEKDFDFDQIGRARVIDVRSRSPKYPFVVQSTDGSKYAVSAHTVMQAYSFGNHF